MLEVVHQKSNWETIDKYMTNVAGHKVAFKVTNGVMHGANTCALAMPCEQNGKVTSDVAMRTAKLGGRTFTEDIPQWIEDDGIPPGTARVSHAGDQRPEGDSKLRCRVIIRIGVPPNSLDEAGATGKDGYLQVIRSGYLAAIMAAEAVGAKTLTLTPLVGRTLPKGVSWAEIYESVWETVLTCLRPTTCIRGIIFMTHGGKFVHGFAKTCDLIMKRTPVIMSKDSFAKRVTFINGHLTTLDLAAESGEDNALVQTPQLLDADRS